MEDDIDFESLSALKSFIGTKYKDLLETFITSSDRHLESILKSYAASDYQGLGDAAHPLKSSAGNMGLKRVRQLALEVEEYAEKAYENKEDAAGLSQKIPLLAQAYQRGRAFLLASLEE